MPVWSLVVVIGHLDAWLVYWSAAWFFVFTLDREDEDPVLNVQCTEHYRDCNVQTYTNKLQAYTLSLTGIKIYSGSENIGAWAVFCLALFFTTY